MLFSARRLAKHYAAGAPGCSAVVRVLDGVDLELAAGHVVGVQGDRGSGKTTLLRCVAGLARPDAGVLRWAPGAASPVITALAPAAHPFETVGDVVERTSARDAVSPERLHEALALLELDSLAGRTLAVLTTDERARLALAITLGIPHPLLLLDGTVDALAAASRPIVRALLRAHAADGGAVLMAGRDRVAVAALSAECRHLTEGRLGPLARPERRVAAARVAEAPTAPAVVR
ncbi:MAG TPA: ATP-binding cassette domain-containing protein [Gemmatimonadaceae bacterium]|jgi:ABC-type transport system involved in cytochrome c biogenesis ATPase subunit|nr:ATP-binding cassette domain-containing protein [Gemmatimonadaceae bacterium]